jgi:hypothetical protein
MTTARPLLLLSFALVMGTSPAEARLARACKVGACRQVINRCVKQSCAQFHGRLKAGCVLAARTAIRGACNLAQDHAAYCDEISRNDCSPP